MKLNFISLAFLVVACVAYGVYFLNRTSFPLTDNPREDVICIALIGILAHLAFERKPIA